jgi:bifunctional non-homologous end joining protein LigD
MAPTLAPEPFHRDGWIYEEKYDGWRMLAYKDGATVRLISRNGRDHTARFADIAAHIARLPAATLILDGEICVFDENLISQFHLLGEENRDVLATPPVYVAFDCLYADGRDLRAEPLARRREALEQAINGATIVLPARRLPPHGLAAWDVVKQCGYEGLVAKDEAAAYRAGPTRSWLKVKVRYEGTFIVGGIMGQPGAFEGLLVGERVGRRLLYRGVVEWGVRRATVEALLARCAVVPVSPFSDPPRARRVAWLRPTVKVEITYNEMCEDRLRDSVSRGLVPIR